MHGILSGKSQTKKGNLRESTAGTERWNARIDTENSDYALQVEENYCSPPLAMERESVLDQYFNDIDIQRVESEEETWNKIKDKPLLQDKR